MWAAECAQRCAYACAHAAYQHVAIVRMLAHVAHQHFIACSSLPALQRRYPCTQTDRLISLLPSGGKALYSLLPSIYTITGRACLDEKGLLQIHVWMYVYRVSIRMHIFITHTDTRTHTQGETCCANTLLAHMNTSIHIRHTHRRSSWHLQIDRHQFCSCGSSCPSLTVDGNQLLVFRVDI